VLPVSTHVTLSHIVKVLYTLGQLNVRLACTQVYIELRIELSMLLYIAVALFTKLTTLSKLLFSQTKYNIATS